MRFKKLIFASVIAVLLMSSQAFSQATAEKKENTQPEQTKKIDSTKPKPSEKYSKYKKKKDVPEVPLTNARITFENTVFDFGMVPPGNKVTYNFQVSNTGPDTLNITKIKAG